MIALGLDECGELREATSREWLETNGIGGFASSTVAGLNTRRYHGLLVASLRPPVERFVLLSKLEETLVAGGQRWELSANRYPGVVHPQGYRFLEAFRLDPFPHFTYRAHGIVLEKSLFMVDGENTTVVRYRLLEAPAGAEVRLEVRPLIAFRDYHRLTHENEALDPRVQTAPGRVTVRPYPALPPLHFAHDASELDPGGGWYRKFQYEAERERGLDWEEDLYSPFTLRFDLEGRRSAAIIASVIPRAAEEADELREREVRRRQEVQARAPGVDEALRALAAAADQFLVAREAGKTVIAGYHWFTDWGRDTMIALPGLTLATGRPETAREILLEFSRHVDQGLLPNRFPDRGETAEYNTVDATLWYFEAVRALGEATGDYDWIRAHLYGVLTGIIDRHLRGTRHGIGVDADGLLRAGEPGLQLTWMDAKVGDWVVTPRSGKPVEIQALWYNALRVIEELANRFEDPGAGAHYGALARRASESFNERFWNGEGGCLYDVVDGETGDIPDRSLRPNQVLAVSLPHTMLPADRAASVVEVVRRHLLTPYGLRSLSPADPRYAGVYQGDVRSRDGSYHQGTVWAWLMGPFIRAYLHVNRGSAASRAQASEWLQPLREHLREAGLGQVSEIFDGDPPHTPRGCIAQAWSVAELLRALVDVTAAETDPPAHPETLPPNGVA